jgi:hypothetical protein
VRRDRQLARELEAFAREEARNRRALAAEAAGPDGPAALFAGLLDIDVYRSLRREGFATAEAADHIAALLNQAPGRVPGAVRRSRGEDE